MLHLGKRIHPAPPATADLTDDPSGADCCPRRRPKLHRQRSLRRLGSWKHDQIHIGRGTQGRLIRHAGALTLSVLALAVAMILTPPGCSLVAAVGLAALDAARFFVTARAAVLLASITVRAEVKHRPAGRETAHALTKDCRTSSRHRFCEGALDNRHRSWQGDSRLVGAPLESGPPMKNPWLHKQAGFSSLRLPECQHQVKAEPFSSLFDAPVLAASLVGAR